MVAALIVLVAAGALSLALQACGSKQDVIAPGTPHPYTLMLDFFPNADHAAIYEAIARGDFHAAGLDVEPQAPSDPSAPLKLLAAGKVDMAIAYEPEVLLARDQGLKVISVGALVQRPLTSIIALPGSHVKRVADLAGKRVGTAGIDYQTAELDTILAHAGVNPASVAQTNVGFNLVPAMLSGKVAATIGGFWNYEAIQLQMLHKHPLVIPVDRAGVPPYDELVLVVRQGEARGDGEDIRAFMHALWLGQQAAAADPAGAAKLLVKANPDLQQPLQVASIKATMPAEQSSGGKPFGWQSPAQWAAFGRWMYAQHLLRRNPTQGQPPFTNEYLPGQGV